MQLINGQNQLEEVPQDEVPKALTSGQYQMPKGEPVNVINPRGELVSLPPEDVYEATQSGYKFPSSADITKHVETEKYGDRPLTAFGLGALRGGTFGASDVLARYVGQKTGAFKPEDLAKIQEYNPGTSLGGELVGAGVSALAAPEVSLPGLVAKGSRIVGKEAASFLASQAEHLGGGALAESGAQVLGKVAGGALEGAAYGVGHGISEAALGNEDANAQNLLANIGYGAAFGGGFGGLLGIGEEVVPPMAAKLKEALGNAFEKSIGKPLPEGGFEPGAVVKGIGKVGGSLTGQTEDEFLQSLKTPFMDAKEQSAFEGKAIKALQEILDSGEVTSKKIAENKATSVAELLKGADNSAVIPHRDDVLKKLDTALTEMRDNPDIYSPGVMKKVQTLRDGFESRIKDDSSLADAFNETDALKKRIDDTIKPIKDTADYRAVGARDLMRNVRSDLMSTLEDQSRFGAGAAQQATLNRAWSDNITARNNFTKAFTRKIEVRGGQKVIVDPTKIRTYINSANSEAGLLRGKFIKDLIDSSKGLVDEAGKVHSAAQIPFDKDAAVNLLSSNKDFLEKETARIRSNPNMQQGFFTDKWSLLSPLIGSLPRKIAESVVNHLTDPDVLARTVVGLHKASSKVGTSVDKIAKNAFRPIIQAAELSKEGVKKALSKEAIEKSIQETQDRVNNPEKMADDVSSATKHLQPYAPNHAQALQRAMIQGSLFLKSKIPDWSDNSSNRPFDAPKKPTPAELHKYSRYIQAMNDPVGVMKQAMTGYVSQEGLETLQSVYPDLYGKMRQALISEITDKKAKNPDISMPYQKRLAISQFIGVDLDSSLNPSNVAANQAILAQGTAEKQQQEQGQPKSTSKGISAIDLAQRSATTFQKSSARDS